MATTSRTQVGSYEEWAAALTDEQLARRLHQAAESIKWGDAKERAAIFTEAANRLGWPMSRNPQYGTAPTLKLGEAPAEPATPAATATPAADAADQEASAGRAPRRRKTGDPRADRTTAA
jgi:hypothetical protein